jgi:hypothetical protein
MAFNIQKHKELTQVTTLQDSALGIMKWGTDNSFPQTLKNLVEQSPTAKPAVERTAKFLKGAGFDGENEVVNPYGLTLKQVVSIIADDYALFKAFGIHCNFNVNGEVVGINPMRVAELRFNEFDELNFASKIGYHPNFGRNSEVKKSIDNLPTKDKIRWINRFNPEAVVEQIENTGRKVKGIKKDAGEIAVMAAGIGNYRGQVLYHSDAGHSSYPISPLQAPINYVLSDVENSILVRKETSTGFINSYLLKTTLDSEDKNLEALELAIEEAQGARGTGKIITMSGLSPEEMSSTVLEEIGGGAGASKAVIESSQLAYELSQKVINGAYMIPPILAGADQKTGFSSADLKEAYFVFNANTQGGRDIIEAELNRILENSIFKTKKISIKKLKLDENEEVEENDSVVNKTK